MKRTIILLLLSITFSANIFAFSPDNHPAYKTIVWYDKLRYRMMPYLYSMTGWVHFKDYTMMRPLVMDFTDDSRVLDIKDQWMFESSLMACPMGYYKAVRVRSTCQRRADGMISIPANTTMADILSPLPRHTSAYRCSFPKER